MRVCRSEVGGLEETGSKNREEGEERFFLNFNTVVHPFDL